MIPLLEAAVLLIAILPAHMTPLELAEKANTSHFSAADTNNNDDDLSSYLREGRICRPGHRLKTLQTKAGVPYVPFLILTEAHSGSTWMRTMLNSHPCIRSHGETLRHRHGLGNIWHAIASPTNTDSPGEVDEPSLFAAGCKGFFSRASGGGNAEFNPNNKGVFEPLSRFLLSTPFAVIIHLRRNPLDRFLSFEREGRTGRPHCQEKAGCDISKVHEMTYNVDGKRLIDFLHTAEVNDEKASSMLKQLGRSVLEVPYADLVADPAVAEEWWNTILEFLGISRDDYPLLQSEWRRQIIKGHNETIRNYEQIMKILKEYEGGKFLPLL